MRSPSALFCAPSPPPSGAGCKGFRTSVGHSESASPGVRFARPKLGCKLGAVSNFIIRPACAEDAEQAVRVIRASISELCQADHHDDATTLERWLGNKTVGAFRRWLANPNSFFVVPELGGDICGVAAINRGEVTLCYVQPGRERSGLGTAMLGALEARAKDWQLAELRLHSTDRARAFYERRGYVATGEVALSHGSRRAYGYAKQL